MSSSFDPGYFSHVLLRLYVSSVPVSAKSDQMLRAVSDAFGADRYLLLRPETIMPGGLFSRSLAEKKSLWVEEASSFDREGWLPAEADLIQTSFFCLPLCDDAASYGLLYLGFSKKRAFSSADVDFATLASKLLASVIGTEEMSRELKKAQAQLVHQGKMAALGEMCSTIAHEIENPLVAIGGFARRLYRTILPEAPERRYSQTIIIEVARLERILRDIMQYTDGSPVALEKLDLRVVIDDSLSALSDDFIDGVRLVKEYPEDLPQVRGNYQQLKQTFFNLIMNAHQAVNGEGTVAVKVYPFREEEGPSCVKVEVEDDGPGIQPEHLGRIFTPFFSTKESGLGLGLASVHKVVTSLRGQIEVDNRPGRGVRFVLTFPVEEENGRTATRRL